MKEINHETIGGRATAVRAVYVAEEPSDPLGMFPTLAVRGVPYNRWLTSEILDPWLRRWRERGPDDRMLATAIRHDFERASGRVRAAFTEVLPAAASAGDTAILAAMGVAANLQRTMAMLGEFTLGGVRRRPSETVLPLSRLWCGLIEYPADAPYFFARRPRRGDPARLRANRRDAGHLRMALWCSTREIDQRCAEAIAALRREIRQSGLFTPDDLRHLHSHAASRPD